MMHRKKTTRITSSEKRMILNVKEFFEKEKHQQQCIKKNEVIKRIAMATGVSKNTVKAVKREIVASGIISSPEKRYKRKGFAFISIILIGKQLDAQHILFTSIRHTPL